MNPETLALIHSDFALMTKSSGRKLSYASSRTDALPCSPLQACSYTETLTGNGVLEAWKIGAISPFNDGKESSELV